MENLDRIRQKLNSSWMKYQSALEKREPDTITKTWKSFQYWVSEFKKARGKG